VSLRTLLAGLTMLLTGTTAIAQITGDVMGVHSLGPGSKSPIAGTISPITGARPDACAYCHAPHSGGNIGLWNQKLTTQVYSTYQSNTEKNIGTPQPKLGASSNQCLSCHDGTVAVGSTIAYGQVTMRGSMNTLDVFGTNLQTSHPFSLAMPLKDNVHLVASLAATGKSADPTGVKLIDGNVECISCHNPHVQSKDQISENFLVKDSSSGALCLSCHDPSRQMGNQVNPLADWSISAHAISAIKITGANLGSYPTVGADACISCHTPHNANGPTELLRRQNETGCLTCHNGASNTSQMKPHENVAAEYASGKVGHPFPSGTDNAHDAAESVLLQNNRHATCVDCHNAHGSQQVPDGEFPAPPQIRLSQKDVAGINDTDGISVLAPAVNQYENCLRCHGNSGGKQELVQFGYLPARAVPTADPLNVIPQFLTNNTSSHPVMHVGDSTYSQPSLRSTMLNLDGSLSSRTLSVNSQILCTDCHNSDDNREFGGSGANGPHGSKWLHILERDYEFSQAPGPGQQITNPITANLTSVTGPYALCAKCHDLSNILGDNSFTKHSLHINAGFSCSVCHTAHGVGATGGGMSGERLVNFDVKVVGPNGGTISYNQASKTCTLACHDPASPNIYVHSGSAVTAVQETMGLRPVARK
jgi:predicted CXXCH cytochrome family protein